MAKLRPLDIAEHQYESSFVEEPSNVHSQLLPHDSTGQRIDPDSIRHHDETHHHLSRVGVYCVLLYFLVEMSDMISIAPLTALLEQSVCRSYFEVHNPSMIVPGGSVREDHCKLKPIQAELAVVRGWKLAFDTLPGKNNRNDGICIIQ